MRIGDKIQGKVIDKYVLFNDIHYIVELKGGGRIEIMLDGFNSVIIVGDKILVEKLSSFINKQNLKVTILEKK